MSSLATVSAREGKFAVRWDECRKLIHFELSGFASEEDLIKFYSEIRNLWERSKILYGSSMLLIDALKASVQNPSLLSGSIDFRHSSSPEDKIAVLVSSHLLKMQIRRKLTQDNSAVEFFTCPEAAMTWLTA